MGFLICIAIVGGILWYIFHTPYGMKGTNNQKEEIDEKQAEIIRIQKAVSNMKSREDKNLTLKNIESKIKEYTGLEGSFRLLTPNDTHAQYYQPLKENNIQFDNGLVGYGYLGANYIFTDQNGHVITFCITLDVELVYDTDGLLANRIQIWTFDTIR